MSFLDLTNDVVQSANFEPIPSGTYIARVDKAEVRPTKAGDGKFINVRLKITGGEHSNRVVFHKFNIENKSEQAQKIGRGELKAMLLAAGKSPVIETVSDLEGLHVAVKVSQEKDYKGEMTNAIKGFLSLDAKQSDEVKASF